MPYEDIPIAHVLNYVLADGFDASDETDVATWLGGGKTIAEMLGHEASQSFYTTDRRLEIAEFIQYLGLHELQCFLNDDDAIAAVVLSQGAHGELVFMAGNPKGTPAISTDWFKRNRTEMCT